MLTEAQVRDLLAAAGTTVPVDPAPVVTPADSSWRGRSWHRVAAVAAAVTLLCGGAAGLWLTRIGEEHSSRSKDVAVTLDGVPVGSVPSVFGHTRESATELLEGLDLHVEYDDVISCDPEGRPVGTSPATGTPIRPGQTVTLQLAHQDANTDCMRDLREPWAFIDFAHGRAPAPRFADEVTLVVDGGDPVVLSGERAAKGDWANPSALSELRTAAAQVVRLGDEYRTPSLNVHEGTPPDKVCGLPRPASVGTREALLLAIELPTDGIDLCPTQVAIYRTGGRIDSVVTWTGRPGSAARDAIPSVVGLSLTEARATVTAAGYTTRVEEQAACDPRPGVVEQAPTQQAVDEDWEDDPSPVYVVTLVVEVPHPTRDCTGLETAARQFRAFARGGPAPRWAPQVEVLLGYTVDRRLDPAQADDVTSWSMCSGVDAGSCRINPLHLMQDGEVLVSDDGRPLVECDMTDRGGLPLKLVEPDTIVVHPPPSNACADQWAVEIWIDAEQRIHAVNLLIGIP